MTTKRMISISLLSGVIGALFSALLFVSITNSNAAVTTSGYYVCENKTTSALRMSAPVTNKCTSGDYRYFFASSVSQAPSPVDQGLTGNTTTISYLASGYSCPSGARGLAGAQLVAGVAWNGPTGFNSPLTVNTQSFPICQLTVRVP